MNEPKTSERVLPDGRMSVRAAAAYVGLAVATLAIHRCRGTGPKFLKLGRVWYFREDLDAWVAAAGRHIGRVIGLERRMQTRAAHQREARP